MSKPHEAPPHGAPEPRRSEAVACLSVLLMLAAAGGLLVGVLVYVSSRDSAESHGGTGGALSGLGEVVGMGVMAAALLAFILGAVIYLRSAR